MLCATSCEREIALQLIESDGCDGRGAYLGRGHARAARARAARARGRAAAASAYGLGQVQAGRSAGRQSSRSDDNIIDIYIDTYKYTRYTSIVNVNEGAQTTCNAIIYEYTNSQFPIKLPTASHKMGYE